MFLYQELLQNRRMLVKGLHTTLLIFQLGLCSVQDCINGFGRFQDTAA